MTTKTKNNNLTHNYKNAGVDVEAGYELVEKIKPYVAKTKRAEILSGLGSFSALSRLPRNIENPILVTCTDGVGTKIDIAKELNQYDSIGIDLVAMCVNDLIACGAEPLLFLDYYVTDKLKVETAVEVIKSISIGCSMSNCSLVGGETAEHPNSFPVNTFDLAGFAVGVVDENKIIGAEGAKQGDVIIGLSSSGVHSNGFSLIRKILKDNRIDLNEEISGTSIGERLLRPTRIYVEEILALKEKVNISAISHITGGGFYENIPRMLDKKSKAVINFKIEDWPSKDLYSWLSSQGVSIEDMLGTFNCGVGMVISLPPEDANTALKLLNTNKSLAKIVGEVKSKKSNEDSLEIYT